MMSDPQFLTRQPTIAVVDVETTGLYAAFGDRVCEVGIVTAQGETIIDTYQALVNPLRPISPGAARVNGLSDAQVRSAPPFAEIAGEVLARIDGRVLVCHNAPFDLSFLEAELSRFGQPWQPAGVIDTLEIARRHFRFPSNSLGSLAARLGIATPQAHRALGDALTTFEVYRRFSRRLAERGGLSIAALMSSYRPAAPVSGEGLLPPALNEALAANRAVEIRYVDANGSETRRTITPRRVLVQNGVVYLAAYCHVRQAERNFRLDRIVAVWETK